MRKAPSPAPQTARFIAKILASRPTSIEEVPMLVAGLGNTLGNLLDPQPKDPQAERQAVAGALDRLAAAVDTAEPAPPPRRKASAARAPRRVVAAAQPAATPPAAPRLMRRAEVAHPEPAIPELLQSPPEGRRRGVVRWFDARTGRGMLRIPGFAEDVPLDPEILQRTGLTRLYKGQEIEATVAGENGHAHLVSLTLPGQATAAVEGGLKTGGMRRHAKPVVVEMKRDSLRRAAARVEAEHVLGSPPRGRNFGAD